MLKRNNFCHSLQKEKGEHGKSQCVRISQKYFPFAEHRALSALLNVVEGGC